MMKMRVALDAMGGDYGSVPNIQGALAAVEKLRNSTWDLQVLLCGVQSEIEKSLEEAERASQSFRFRKSSFEEYLNQGVLQMIDCPEVVGMDESPSAAVRNKKNSSMAQSFQLVKESRADAVVSAGNSGAMMAYGMGHFGRMASVKRPAILCHFPSRNGVTALLDAGANAECESFHLEQFAIMGVTYMQEIFSKPSAKVALLNIGEEESKGNELVKSTHAQLKEKMPNHYVGFVEGRDVMSGKVDVIVCDGFVGNVVLKTAEGVAQLIKTILKDEFSRNPIWTLGAWLAKGGFSAMKTKLDYREYGAAPLVGLDGLALVAHGSSDDKAMFNAIRMAGHYIENSLIQKLKDNLNAYQQRTEAS